MNLHAIASQVIPIVNPMIPATIKVSLGSATGPDGRQTPTFLVPPQAVTAQVQSLTYKDIQQVNSLNLQGVRVAIYLYGHFDALVRVSKKGGDIITINPPWPYAGIYLTAQVLEWWPDWCKVAATLQNGS